MSLINTGLGQGGSLLLFLSYTNFADGCPQALRGYQKREFSGGRTVLFCQPNRILKAMVTRVKSFACKINIKINTLGYDNDLNAH